MFHPSPRRIFALAPHHFQSGHWHFPGHDSMSRRGRGYTTPTPHKRVRRELKDKQKCQNQQNIRHLWMAQFHRPQKQYFSKKSQATEFGKAPLGLWMVCLTGFLNIAFGGGYCRRGYTERVLKVFGHGTHFCFEI